MKTLIPIIVDDNGKNFKRPDDYVVDNCYVIPYCSILSIIFNCHINVEVVSSIKSVKYLYKYIYRGHDAAAITTEPINNVIIDHDEIHNFIETCYVGPVQGPIGAFSKRNYKIKVIL